MDVDRTALPNFCHSHFRVAVLGARGPGSKSLQAYSQICQEMVPNVSTDQLITTGAAYNVVITKSGDCIGGLTFRLVDVEVMPCVGTPRAQPDRKIACDILLAAVREDHQGKALGSWLVSLTKRITTAQAIARGIDAIHMVVQADLGAVSFWRKLGFGSSPAARRLVAGLSRWRPAENLIYIGVTPLGVHIDLKAGQLAPMPPNLAVGGAEAPTVIDVVLTGPCAADAAVVVAGRRTTRRCRSAASHVAPTASAPAVSLGDEHDVPAALHSGASAAGGSSRDSIEGDHVTVRVATSTSSAYGGAECSEDEPHCEIESGEAEGGGWRCVHCTLLNDGWRLKCRLCQRTTKRQGVDGAFRWPRAIVQLCDTSGNGPSFASSLDAAVHQLPPLYIPIVGESHLSVGKSKLRWRAPPNP